jgi:tetratricopeptide (TPR) repeat protein
MSNKSPGPLETPGTPLIIKISPEILLNKNKKAGIIKDTYFTICGLLNSYHGGILKLTSSKSLTPATLDELVRGIEQTLIELLGLTGLREYCQTEIKELGKEIIFTVMPSDRIFTVEYNLVLPTDFLVKQVHRTEPLEKIARVLKPAGRQFVSARQHNRVKEFEKESTMPEDLRESDTVQFKKVKSDRNTNKSLADRIIANKITHYIAAFANHKGGHVFIGIDDETYKVCGQIVINEERQRIVEKITSAVENMVWPEKHGKPKLGKHWDISFFPVLDATSKEDIPDLFVIVVAIACCPGGVFLSHPEAYEYNDGKIQRMEFNRWKKRLLHDAHMRDIIKFCNENSWTQNVGTCKITESERRESKASGQDDSPVSAVSDSACSSIPLTIPKVSPPNTKSRVFCGRITDYMEQLIQDGNFDKLQTFASKICPKKVFPGADIEVAVRFMLALGAYRRREFAEAYDELEKASPLIASSANADEFQVQRLHLLACFSRGEGEYDTSYKVTYDALQEIEGISAGWHTAWVLNDAGYLFNILACEERNEEVRNSLKQQAISLYTKAIDHTLAIEEKRKEPGQSSVLKSNLLHRCHIRRAMLSLGCKPLAEDDDDNQEVTKNDVDIAVASILVVEESSLKGDSLTDVNECHLCLVKSDLNYRRSQFNQDQQEKYVKTARDWAMKARNLADKDQFRGIIKYAQTRLDRLAKIHCLSSVEESLIADLNNIEERHS